MSITFTPLSLFSRSNWGNEVKFLVSCSLCAKILPEIQLNSLKYSSGLFRSSDMTFDPLMPFNSMILNGSVFTLLSPAGLQPGREIMK